MMLMDKNERRTVDKFGCSPTLTDPHCKSCLARAEIARQTDHITFGEQLTEPHSEPRSLFSTVAGEGQIRGFQNRQKTLHHSSDNLMAIGPCPWQNLGTL